MFRNYHTHTTRCHHAEDSEETYILKAIESGYDTLGFSDHSPWPFPNGFVSHCRMLPSELGDYVQTIRALGIKYRDKIDIHIGLECEYYPEFYGWLIEQKEAFGLEYFIFGNHALNSKEKRWFHRDTETPEMLYKFAENTVRAIESGLFSYIAHPEVAFFDYPTFDTHCAKISQIICEAAKAYDIPLEYNLYGVNKRERGKNHGLGYPYGRFWDIAAKVGNTAIIGVDAHKSEMLTHTDRIVTAQNYLEELGMTVTDVIKGVNA